MSALVWTRIAVWGACAVGGFLVGRAIGGAIFGGA